MSHAKPSQNDWDRAYELIHGLESICEYGEHPEQDGVDIEPEDAVDWIRIKLAKFSLWRVVGAGQCAIANACDPNRDYLAYKPEIEQALLAAKAREEAAL